MNPFKTHFDASALTLYSIALASLLASGPALAGGDCLGWSTNPLTTPTNPTQDGPDLVYDQVRHVMVILKANSPGVAEFGPGGMVTMPNAPVSFSGGVTGGVSAAYDTVNQRVLVFILGELWAYNGFQWTQLPSLTLAGPNPGLLQSAMVFDSLRGMAVVFGGERVAPPGGFDNRTWEFNGTSWSQKVTPHSPQGRKWPSMTFDSRRGRTVLFGGTVAGGGTPNDTWEYDGADWVQVAAASTPNAPPGAFAPAMTFDSTQGLCIVHGRSTDAGPATTLASRTWTWDGIQWQERIPISVPPTVAPIGMAYDPGYNVVRRISNGAHFELEFAAAPPSITQQPVSHAAIAGTMTSFQVTAAGQGPLTYQWRHNGAIIPGATGPTLTLGAVAAAAGTYDCVVRNVSSGEFSCGMVTSNPATLIVGPSCPGDLSGNGQVNGIDLAMLLGQWGVCD